MIGESIVYDVELIPIFLKSKVVSLKSVDLE